MQVNIVVDIKKKNYVDLFVATICLGCTEFGTGKQDSLPVPYRDVGSQISYCCELIFDLILPFILLYCFLY